jgi:hypothetical protein
MKPKTKFNSSLENQDTKKAFCAFEKENEYGNQINLLITII